jgi:hypothetical protein
MKGSIVSISMLLSSLGGFQYRGKAFNGVRVQEVSLSHDYMDHCPSTSMALLMPQTAISSSYLRNREKILEESHQKELAVLESKINKLKWANRDALNQLFEANNRAHNLALSIGFKDIYHALSIVSSHQKTSYIANIERGKALEEDVLKRTAENVGLKEELNKIREERDILKSELEVERTSVEAGYVLLFTVRMVLTSPPPAKLSLVLLILIQSPPPK